MIYTITFNPALDYIVRLDHLKTGTINRTIQEYVLGGGKGINVSIVLNNLGMDTTALGFIAGFTGEEIVTQLKKFGVKEDFIRLREGLTRINVKVKASDEETEINGNGPEVTEAQLQELLNILSSLTTDDVVVFAGSAPSSLGNAVYKQLIAATRATGAQVVCDFEGQTLIDSLEFNPQLVKPNNHELGDIFGVTLTELPEIERYAKEILAKGAQNVIISMAGDGALLVSPNGTYFAKPIKGQVKNSVGAGDSMVAGFTGKLATTGDVIEAFKWGVACGTATTFSDDLATADYIKETYEKVEVEKL